MHYPCTVPLSELGNWSALLEKILLVMVEPMDYGPEIDPNVSETSLKPSIPSIVDLPNEQLET